MVGAFWVSYANCAIYRERSKTRPKVPCPHNIYFELLETSFMEVWRERPSLRDGVLD